MSVVARAFTPFLDSGDLSGKHSSGGETGLGLTNHWSGDKEVANGGGYVHLDVSDLTAALSVGSTAPPVTITGPSTALIPPGPGSWRAPGRQNLDRGRRGREQPEPLGALGTTTSSPLTPRVSNVLLKSLTVAGVLKPASWGLMIAGILFVGRP